MPMTGKLLLRRLNIEHSMRLINGHKEAQKARRPCSFCLCVSCASLWLFSQYLSAGSISGVEFRAAFSCASLFRERGSDFRATLYGHCPLPRIQHGFGIELPVGDDLEDSYKAGAQALADGATGKRATVYGLSIDTILMIFNVILGLNIRPQQYPLTPIRI